MGRRGWREAVTRCIYRSWLTPLGTHRIGMAGERATMPVINRRGTHLIEAMTIWGMRASWRNKCSAVIGVEPIRNITGRVHMTTHHVSGNDVVHGWRNRMHRIGRSRVGKIGLTGIGGCTLVSKILQRSKRTLSTFNNG